MSLYDKGGGTGTGDAQSGVIRLRVTHRVMPIRTADNGNAAKTNPHKTASTRVIPGCARRRHFTRSNIQPKRKSITPTGNPSGGGGEGMNFGERERCEGWMD